MSPLSLTVLLKSALLWALLVTAQGSKHSPAAESSHFLTFNSSYPHSSPARGASSRHKRFVYFTRDRRLVFPPGAGFFITPTLSLPFIRNMRTGYGTGMTISVPFKLNFDKLGWAAEEHPYGLFPGLSVLRKKREDNYIPFGTTEHIYGIFEDIVSNLGYPGKVCLQRAVCEMREGPLSHSYGWLKDILEYVLTPSLNSKSKNNLKDYFEAEKMGRNLDCSLYHKCSVSIFFSTEKKNKSTISKRKHSPKSQEELTNEISDTKAVKYKKIEKWNNELNISQNAITVESLAKETQMKRVIDKIQQIAMLHSFKQIIR